MGLVFWSIILSLTILPHLFRSCKLKFSPLNWSSDHGILLEKKDAWCRFMCFVHVKMFVWFFSTSSTHLYLPLLHVFCLFCWTWGDFALILKIFGGVVRNTAFCCNLSNRVIRLQDCFLTVEHLTSAELMSGSRRKVWHKEFLPSCDLIHYMNMSW